MRYPGSSLLGRRKEMPAVHGLPMCRRPGRILLHRRGKSTLFRRHILAHAEESQHGALAGSSCL
jgi:hypothetical protein